MQYRAVVYESYALVVSHAIGYVTRCVTLFCADCSYPSRAIIQRVRRIALHAVVTAEYQAIIADLDEFAVAQIWESLLFGRRTLSGDLVVYAERVKNLRDRLSRENAARKSVAVPA